MTGGQSDYTIRLAVMDSEPLARLAEQRLKEEGIVCMVRVLGAGPGGWGMDPSLPHGLYVRKADEMLARQVLDLPPQELLEREDSNSVPTSRRWLPLAIVVLVTAAVVLSSLLLSTQGS